MCVIVEIAEKTGLLAVSLPNTDAIELTREDTLELLLKIQQIDPQSIAPKEDFYV